MNSITLINSGFILIIPLHEKVGEQDGALLFYFFLENLYSMLNYHEYQCNYQKPLRQFAKLITLIFHTISLLSQHKLFSYLIDENIFQ